MRCGSLCVGFVLWPVLPWGWFSWMRGVELWRFALMRMAPAALGAIVASLWPAARADEPQRPGEDGLLPVVERRERERVGCPADRVDLGLRLDTTQPGGRIQPARALSQATVRIPLTTPGEVDDEVRAWLTKAYDENTAPPTGKPGPPARPKPVRRAMSGISCRAGFFRFAPPYSSLG